MTTRNTREKRPQARHLRTVNPADTSPADNGVTGGAAQVAAAKVSATKAPPRGVDPEVVPGPRRRAFTAEFKRQVLAEADACTEPGAVGELLRKHGLYSSHLSEWRRQRDEGLRPKKRGRKANGQRALVEENAQLKRDKLRLEQQLVQAKVIIDVQKKLSGLLGIPLNTPDLDGSNE
jgi:transposase